MLLNVKENIAIDIDRRREHITFVKVICSFYYLDLESIISQIFQLLFVIHLQYSGYYHFHTE